MKITFRFPIDAPSLPELHMKLASGFLRVLGVGLVATLVAFPAKAAAPAPIVLPSSGVTSTAGFKASGVGDLDLIVLILGTPAGGLAFDVRSVSIPGVSSPMVGLAAAVFNDSFTTMLAGPYFGDPISFASGGGVPAGTYLLGIGGTGGAAAGTFGSIYSVGINVTAVPEPEIYAMFLAGLGVVGAMVRRRRKNH